MSNRATNLQSGGYGGRCTGDAAGDFCADNRGDFRAEQFDGVHEFVVGHCADAELHQKALVVEDRMLEQDFLDDVVRAADEIRAAQFRRRLAYCSRRRGDQPRSRPILFMTTCAAGKTHRLPPDGCQR